MSTALNPSHLQQADQLQLELPTTVEPKASHSVINSNISLYDRQLMVCVLLLLSIGLVMVISASMPVAERLYNNPFQISIKHIVFIGLASIAALVTLHIPMHLVQRASPYLLMMGVVLLIAVLLIGKTVNGSTRWINLGPINIQAAEPAKLFFFCYLAGYLVRRHEEVTENLKGFIKPLAVMFVMAILLLSQPDLGTVIVLFTTTVGMLFLAGAKLWQFFALIMTGISAFVALIVTAEYRMRRVMSFMNPWEDPFGSGYQLTQSLMAYGRGDWLGQGLGNSIQKLEYLPEAHTDFVFAILAEETGFLGVCIVLTLLLVLVFKALMLGRNALEAERYYEGFLAYAIGIWIGFQTAVNVGVSAGALPTKGLTLPLISFGGSSLIVMMVAIALLMRIDYELRLSQIQATQFDDTKAKQGGDSND
jgi:cell division protein FtsW